LVIPFKITLPSTNRIVCDIEDVKARKVYEAYKEFFKKMAAGDSQRAWFPEMLNDLKEKWSFSLSWEARRELCDEMTKKRERIRAEKGIKPVRRWCSNCKAYRNMEPPPISIRSLIFALKKINLINDEEFKKLDSEWKKYQRGNNLNAYGKIKS